MATKDASSSSFGNFTRNQNYGGNIAIFLFQFKSPGRHEPTNQSTQPQILQQFFFPTPSLIY